MTTIGNKLKELRIEKKYSQVEMAAKLNISRQTYCHIESDKSELSVNTLKQIANILAVPVEDFLFDSVRATSNDFGIEKYKQIILNCLQYGANSKDGKITKTKLAKLVYLADFAWFYKNFVSMSGMLYRRIQQGPVPDQYFRVIDELYESGEITIEPKGTAFMIKANENAPVTKLNNEEIVLIKEISNKWRDKNTQEIVDFSHNQLPWKICSQGEFIPYELITQEDPVNVY